MSVLDEAQVLIRFRADGVPARGQAAWVRVFGQCEARESAIPRCNANGTRKRLAVDHDHVTGEPRGLLCGPHNYELLGKFVGDLTAGLQYLDNPPMARMRAARLKEAG